MKVLSIFSDEAGQQDMSESYYLLTVVTHEQNIPIDDIVADYERRLAAHELPNIPFHMNDLLHGHYDYEGLDQEVRKGLLVHFNALIRQLPINYRTFSYSSYDTSPSNLTARMRRDLVNFAYDHLGWFQSFDSVPVYYDHGQSVVTNAIRQAFDLIVGSQAVDYRHISYKDYRLAQVADYLCYIEHIAMLYAVSEQSKTHDKFFGMPGPFRRNYLKPARRKLMEQGSSTTTI